MSPTPQLKHEKAAILDEIWPSLLESLPTVAVLLDADGRAIAINRAGRDLGLLDPSDAPHPILEGLGAMVRADLDRPERVHSFGRRRTWRISLASLVPTLGFRIGYAVEVRADSESPDPDGSQAGTGVRQLGQIVAEVAHEMRNPLASILANLEAWEGEPEEGFDTYGFRIRRDAQRMVSLMKDLLEFARPSRRQRSLVDPAALIQEVVRSSDLAARVAGVEIETTVNCSDASITGDLLGLQLALRNLVENAIQHSERGAIVELSAEASGDRVRFRIDDRGCGLGADELERFFEPFFTRRKGGSGLGTSIARKVVLEHGGRIEAVNREGGGARICISLPATVFAGPSA